jgi:hypothetical protein
MRVLIQMPYAPAATISARTLVATAHSSMVGFSLDESYAPIPIPDKQPRERVGDTEVGRLFAFNPSPEASTYLVRGEVADEEALAELEALTAEDPHIIGVFSDPPIGHFLVCPGDPAVGNHRDIENLLGVPQLQAQGMDGTNVMVAIVDAGINLEHLQRQGKNPRFDASKSWRSGVGITPGRGAIDRGTMCAFDTCIAAPNCTLLDYALLKSTAVEGFLSDAVQAFSHLLQMLLAFPDPKPALVVSNSWGMFHPSWDFPVGHPGNYSDNPHHPFHILVESLENAGADILFAAGNGGAECPDARCEGVTTRTIYGANSHPSVLCIAGVTANRQRVGYSSQGPGRLDPEKPDLSIYTHFAGSGIYPADSGTSAACAVAAGVVAAIRSVYPPSRISPAQLRQLLRRTAQDLGTIGFDYSHGFGVIEVPKVIDALKKLAVQELRVGEAISGCLQRPGDTARFRLLVGNPLAIELDGTAGAELEVYIKKGAEPTIDSYDYRGYTSLPDRTIKLQMVSAGEYFLMVRAYQGAGDFTLKASSRSLEFVVKNDLTPMSTPNGVGMIDKSDSLIVREVLVKEIRKRFELERENDCF